MTTSMPMHPAERLARRRLESLPGLRWALERAVNHAYEKLALAAETASGACVSPAAFPRLDALAAETAARLDVIRPRLFVRPGVAGGLRLCGQEQPFAVLDAEWLTDLSDPEARAFLGRAMGTGLLDAWGLWTVSDFLAATWTTLGPAAFPLAGLRWALEDWRRAAELSLDRVGALAAGDAAPVRQLLSRGLRGAAASWGEVQPSAWNEQASAFAALTEGWSFGRLRRIGLVLGGGEPWVAYRLAELERWVVTGGLERAKAGDFSEAESTASDATNPADPASREDPFAAGPALWGAFADMGGAEPSDPSDESDRCFCQRQRDRMTDGLKTAGHMATKGFDAAGKAMSAFFETLRQ